MGTLASLGGASAWLAPLLALAATLLVVTVMLLRDHLRLEQHAVALEGHIERLQDRVWQLAESEEQQLEWRDHLLGMGVQASPVMERDYFRSIYFRAPDGLLLEIATDGPGFAVDEPLETLGTELRVPAWLADQREEIEAGLVPLR